MCSPVFACALQHYSTAILAPKAALTTETLMTNYVGRFAPSPTGLLHIGSLIGALASYLDARANGGRWLLRMEDLDPPREVAGAAQCILDALLAHGLQWDGEVLWQSQRHCAYQKALEQLLDQHKAFYCTCSRTDIQSTGGIYSGRCRGCQQRPDKAFAIRLQVPDQLQIFEDAIQGPFSQHLQEDVGDVVLLRKDQLYAYQLAVVVDDAFQGITHIVRGSDLLDSTPRQRFLQQQLAFSTPHYAHFPVITNQSGQKLSKQTFAPALNSNEACANVRLALKFLRQTLPPADACQSTQALLSWAVEHWSLQSVTPVHSLCESSFS